jgi:hypothetical protein
MARIGQRARTDRTLNVPLQNWQQKADVASVSTLITDCLRSGPKLRCVSQRADLIVRPKPSLSSLSQRIQFDVLNGQGLH